MDLVAIVPALRTAERVLAEAGGVLAIWLGYRLFLHVPNHADGQGRFALPGGISIYISRIGPGVFFSLFGSAVLGASLYFGINFETRAPQPTLTAAGTQAGALLSSYSGAAARAPEGEPLQTEVERQSVLNAIHNLNRVPDALSPQLSSASRIDIERAVVEAKLRLMRSVWDKAAWGDPAEFRAWFERGENDPPPPGIRKAVDTYRAGAASPSVGR